MITKDDDLLFRLCRADDYPVTADEAARMIVDELCIDLPSDRKGRIRYVIQKWASERESAVSSTVYESTFER